jgi:hypothetical protein
MGNLWNRGSLRIRRKGWPKVAFANVLVPIDAAAAGLLGVVQMKQREAIETDGAIEREKGLVVTLRSYRCHAQRPADGRVEAHADARCAAGTRDDGCQLLEPVTEIAALAGCVLQEDARPRVCRDASNAESASAMRRSPSSSVLPDDEPGCMTSPSSPSSSARSNSSVRAAIDWARSGAQPRRC